MSQQHSAEVAFHDVSNYFSQEEWKLLHEWQKELYRNVMKEIHQALISLGPLIATTVFSLRAKGKQELVSLVNQDSERRHGIQNSTSEVITGPDVLFRINKEENLCLKNSQETEGRGENDCLNTAFPFLSTNICLRKEEEPASIFIDHLGMEVGGSSTDPIPGHEVVSIHIKDEEETYCMNHKDSRSTSSLTGDRSMNRHGKERDSTKKPPCKASAGKAKVKVQQSSHNGTHSNSQMLVENNWELGGEHTAHCQRGFDNPGHFILHQGTSNVARADAYNECQSNLRNAEHLTGFPDMQQNQRPYTCTECKKSFSLKGNLIAHRRTHTGEKPYPCTDCQKSFSRKSNLNEHRLYKHTGERPYKCTECEMSFTRKNRLIRHRRLHTGT